MNRFSPAKSAFLVSLALCFCFLAAPQGASARNGLNQNTPWNLEADRVQVYQDAQVAEAWGDVTMVRGEDRIQADYARYYWGTGWVYLKGDVKARWQGDTLSAARAEFDLQNQVGWLEDGRIFFAESNIYIEGDDLRRTGPDTYTFSRATVTSCQGEVPAWSVFSRRGKVTVEGYAQLWGPRFQIKDKPVAYVPFATVPVKVKRQSGFLIPELSTSSDLGTAVNLPFYWAVNQENDITLYEYFMSERGFMQGIEYRHTPDLLSKGLWQADFLYDQEIADTEAEEDDIFQGDGLVRPNRERYWVRGKYSGYLADPAWRLDVDLDWVSDQNYLREFDDSFNGFDQSRDEFLDAFGRDIEDDDDLTRTNSVLVKRSWNDWGVDLKAEYVQNLRYINNLDLEDDPTIHRLPELVLNLYRNKLFDFPLEFEAENEAVYFWRREGTTAGRIDLHPRFLLPLEYRGITVIPEIGWRETLWLVEDFENDPAGRDTDDHVQRRGIYDAQVSGFTELFSIFELQAPPEPVAKNQGSNVWTKVKHTIQPEVEWEYIPNQDQSDLPNFDAVDRIAPRNELTYSLINLFTIRQDSIPLTPDEQQPRLRTSYFDLLRLRLEQSYDFREADRDTNRDQFPRRPFSDIEASLIFAPRNYLSFSSTTFFSPYLGQVTEHEHLLNLFYRDFFTGYFGLDFLAELDDDIRRQDQEELAILRLGTDLALGRRWRLNLDNRYDLQEGENLETQIQLTYRHQCYTVGVQYIHTPNDDRVEFKVDLLGL